MEIILFLMIPTLLAFFLSDLEIERSSKTTRSEMKDNILEIEKILNLIDTHYEIELNRMSDRELTNLYRELNERFDQYVEERNADNNKKALEGF